MLGFFFDNYLLITTFTSEKGDQCKSLARGDVNPALPPATSSPKIFAEPFSVDTEIWKYKRHETEGKKANGSLSTLGVRKLIWKGTNLSLQTFFIFRLIYLCTALPYSLIILPFFHSCIALVCKSFTADFLFCFSYMFAKVYHKVPF